MDDDPELAAIRAKLRQEMLGAQAAPAAAPAPEAPAHPVELTDDTFLEFVRGHPVVLVDCWAPWCGPCRILAPTIEALAREMAGRVAVGKVNIDENPRVTASFRIQSIPTMLVFVDGRLADGLVGVLPKAHIAQALERHLARRAGSPGPRRAP